MSKLIPLTQGQFAIVDDEDYERVIGYRWCYTSYGYAQCSTYPDGGYKTKTILMHRLVMNAPKGTPVDHINGNRLDNRRSCNLRFCSTQENIQNQKADRKKKTSDTAFKGVYFCGQTKKWKAKINVSGRQIHLGTFTNDIDAAHAYDEAARQHFGEFARTNF